ncbi:putative transcription factor [Iris pallida]|uniref:Transcription factor n=1 Tax=Iris pallida TaxID=29817 RepID=A0AAX6FC76_IRIPA|nr:putative transcription factor [Iris pallida]
MLKLFFIIIMVMGEELEELDEAMQSWTPNNLNPPPPPTPAMPPGLLLLLQVLELWPLFPQ